MKFIEIDICKVRSSTDQVKLQWLLLNLFLVGRYRMGMMIWTNFWYSYVSFMIFFLWLWGDLVLILDLKLISLVPFFTGAIAEWPAIFCMQESILITLKIAGGKLTHEVLLWILLLQQNSVI